MNITNISNTAELDAARDLRTAMQERVLSHGDDEPAAVSVAGKILQSALAALNEGRSSDAVAQFHDCFTFNDHALALEFTDKPRLTEFLQKSRELFPDTALDIVSLHESGNFAIARWKLTGTQTIPYGSTSYRLPISLHGITIARVENGRIVQWSDYYDHASSRRTSLAAIFTDWVEY
jgi:hypothetical protein